MSWLEKTAAVAGIVGVAFGAFMWWTDQAPRTLEDQLSELKAIRQAIETSPPDAKLAQELREEAGELARAAVRSLDTTDAYIERVYDGVFDVKQGRAVELAGPDGIKVVFSVERLRTANAGLLYVVFNGSRKSLSAGQSIKERNCALTMVEHRQTSARFYWRCP